jgi:hypothetical protein
VITEGGNDPKVVGLVYIAAFAPVPPSRLMWMWPRQSSMVDSQVPWSTQGCGARLEYPESAFHRVAGVTLRASGPVAFGVAGPLHQMREGTSWVTGIASVPLSPSEASAQDQGRGFVDLYFGGTHLFKSDVPTWEFDDTEPVVGGRSASGSARTGA